MPTFIAKPTRIEAAGNKPKRIDEFVGRVNSATSQTSIAHMRSPSGWQEPGQTPEFDEFTLVLSGMLRVETSRWLVRCTRGTGRDRASRRVGPLQHTRSRGRGLHCGLPACLFYGHRSPGRVNGVCRDACPARGHREAVHVPRFE